MATKVHMEALSPTMEEGQLVRWLKQEGDVVTEGDVLAEIETDKATMELVARGSGMLQGIRLREGQTAPVGEVIAVIAAEGEAIEDTSAGTAAAQAGTATEAEPARRREAAVAAGARETARSGATEKPRGTVQEEEVARDQPRTGPAARPERGARDRAEEAAPRRGDGNGGRVRASPLAKKMAREAGVELSAVEGSGPGGRITRRDIEAAVRDVGAAAPAAEPAIAARAPAAPALVVAGADAQEVPVSQMRKTIAKRLVQSIGPVPTFYLTIEVDMTRTMELRERVNRKLEKDGIKASLNDFVIKSVAAALARHPEVNASWGDSIIVRHSRVHIGVAVAIEDGLITPVVRDADRKRVRDIAVEVKELASRAREKKLKPEEYTGATFSISNLGMFGIVEFTAIINPPESGIIAVGAAEQKVVVVDGSYVVQPRMRLTMSCDHRVVDGATGARFLQTVREMIEDPFNIIA